MAHPFIEKLRSRVPYIGRLQARINDLQYRLAAIEAVPALHPASGPQYRELTAPFRNFLRMLQPHDAAPAHKRRFGSDSDGGYIMLDDFGRSRAVLSLGIGTEISWDMAMAGRGLRVIQFDNSIEEPAQKNPDFDFHRGRVVGHKQQPGDVTLEEILELPDLAADNDIIAKIDVEGCEWEILAEAKSSMLARFRQLAIEFHDLRNFIEPPWRAIAQAALQNLIATHVCIHVHGNNCSPFTVIGGIPFPNSFEASFARRGDYAFAPSAAVFPIELDRPCNPRMPDLYLGHWDY